MEEDGGAEARMEQVQPSTYAVGDIHGEVSLARQLIAMLPLRDDDTLVFLGDYLDYGEDSAATITFLSHLGQSRRNCVFLRGNHDDAWLDAWDGVRFARRPLLRGARKAWDDFKGAPPREAGRWLAATRSGYEDDYAYYTHAGLSARLSFARTPDAAKIWGDDSFWARDADWGKPVVVGHYPLPAPLITSRRICIDTRARDTGILTAVRLPDRALFQTPPRAP